MLKRLVKANAVLIHQKEKITRKGFDRHLPEEASVCGTGNQSINSSSQRQSPQLHWEKKCPGLCDEGLGYLPLGKDMLVQLFTNTQNIL